MAGTTTFKRCNEHCGLASTKGYSLILCAGRPFLEDTLLFCTVVVNTKMFIPDKSGNGEVKGMN